MAKTNWATGDTVAATDLNTLGGEVNQKLTSVLTTPKSMAFCFEHCTSSAAYSANQAFHNRRLFRLAVKPTRFRIRFRNRNHLGDSSPSGSIGDIQNLTCVIGVPGVDSTSGEPNGSWVAAPTSVMAATAMANGTELVTQWIDSATYNLNTDTMYQIGYSFLSSSTANGQVCNNGGLSWQNNTASDLTVLAPTLTRANNSAFLQVIIEYETVDALAKTILIIGPSLCGPSAAAGFDNYGELSTFHQMWAMAARCSAVAAHAAGAYANSFNGVNGRWQLFDNFATAYAPDAVIYFAANSSDLAGGSGAAQTSLDVKTGTIGMIKTGKAKYPNARHIVTNIPPRVAFTGTAANTNETERTTNINRFMQMCPVQVERCIDINSPLTDWAAPQRLRSEFTTDGTHLTPVAHSILANLIPVER